MRPVIEQRPCRVIVLNSCQSQSGSALSLLVLSKQAYDLSNLDSDDEFTSNRS